MTTKTPSAFALSEQYLLLATLLAAAVYYALGLGIITGALALTCLGLAWGVFKRYKWAYIACASAGFGAFWLARTGQPFIGAKHWVMGLSLIVLVQALYLHEALGRTQARTEVEPE